MTLGVLVTWDRIHADAFVLLGCQWGIAASYAPPPMWILHAFSPVAYPSDHSTSSTSCSTDQSMQSLYTW